MHVSDVTDDDAYRQGHPLRLATVELLGARTFLAVPLLKDDAVAGALCIYRPEVRPFHETQIGLVQTFADQAMIAIENVRLFKELETRNRDLTEALEQQTATAEILRVISSSPTDLQPVLDAVAESAARLCDASDVAILRIEGERVEIAARYESRPSLERTSKKRAAERAPISKEVEQAMVPDLALVLSRETVSGRAIIDRRFIHVPDILDESAREFSVSQEIARRLGFRSILSLPLLREGKAVGVISIRRTEIRPFSEKQIQLARTFADQAVIAIENTRLFNELQTRNRDLTESLEQQTATSEILRVISQSQRDVQPVFETIAANARKLCGAAFGAVFTVDGDLVRVAAVDSVDEAGLEAIARTFPMRPTRGSAIGRAALTGAVSYIPDVGLDAEYSLQSVAQAVGFRSSLSVPMLREGAPIGVIAVAGAEAAMFSERQIGMVQTFADQAVIAIENTRLFNELQTRNRDLTESLEQQTATSEILRVISQSQRDVQPVFQSDRGQCTQAVPRGLLEPSALSMAS